MNDCLLLFIDMLEYQTRAKLLNVFMITLVNLELYILILGRTQTDRQTDRQTNNNTNNTGVVDGGDRTQGQESGSRTHQPLRFHLYSVKVYYILVVYLYFFLVKMC